MEKIEITLEGLVAVADSTKLPEKIKDMAIEAIEYALNKVIPYGLKKVQ
jgi:hypothetical protein